mmetsp:Transcript_69036/g.208885  ORF Transcript_69036/g.208885 Transcript_69036/m.208885 type:complete len:261 (+) Transcript_69036:365-1147(+)
MHGAGQLLQGAGLAHELAVPRATGGHLPQQLGRCHQHFSVVGVVLHRGGGPGHATCVRHGRAAALAQVRHAQQRPAGDALQPRPLGPGEHGAHDGQGGAVGAVQHEAVISDRQPHVGPGSSVLLQIAGRPVVVPVQWLRHREASRGAVLALGVIARGLLGPSRLVAASPGSHHPELLEALGHQAGGDVHADEQQLHPSVDASALRRPGRICQLGCMADLLCLIALPALHGSCGSCEHRHGRRGGQRGQALGTPAAVSQHG